MNIGNRLIAACAALLLASSAKAAPIFQTVDMAMVKTSFNSRSISRFMSDEDAFSLSSAGFWSAWDRPENRICELTSTTFSGLSSHSTCQGPRRNLGTLFTIRGSSRGVTALQFGMDWGRGGFSMLSIAGRASEIVRYNSDIWWAGKWRHRDVLNFVIPETQDFLLLGLGFDGCCDGANAARWRSLDPASEFREWRTVAVNVPEPGAAYLLCLGLLGLGLNRRGQVSNQ